MDGEQNPQEALSGTPGQPSGEGTASPSTAQPKTYTEEEHNRLVAEKHSKLDRQIAQLTRERDQLKQSYETSNTELQEVQRRIDEIEAEKARDNPELLNSYQRKRDLDAREAALKRREQDLMSKEAQHEEDLEAARIVHRDNTISKLAAKYGVEAKLLDKDYLQTPEQLEDYAKTISTVKPKAPEVPGGETPPPDSGVTLGGAGQLTDEQIANMTPEQYAEHPSVKNRFK